MKNFKELKKQIKHEIEKAFREAKNKNEVIKIWEQDKRVKIPKQAKNMFCIGCRQNYYNGTGAKECCSLNKAKLCKRKIYNNLNSIKPEEVITLDCFVKQYK